MKPRILVIMALAVCALGAGCRKEIAPGPDVWAVVDGKQILRQDVERVYRSRVNSEAPAPSHEEQLSLELSILDELINSQILLDRAEKMNLVASDEEVEDRFTQSKAPYTEAEFQQKLQASGLTIDDLKSDIRRQLSIDKLLNREVAAKISITNQDIANFYDKNKSQFDVVEPQFHIAEIVITPHPDPTIHNRKNSKAANEADAGRKAALLIQKLDGGSEFTELAMDYSEDASASTGGDIGFIPESSLNRSDPALKKAVLSLKPGQFTQPIHTKDGGYTILKLVAREPAGNRQLSDPQVQQAIRDALRTRKEQLLRSAYLIEARDEVHVTNYLAREILESAGKLPDSN
ncbi:MAG: SurA N-terminal domain-containing protein [Acidobacteriota bacterium]|nr:SurA N-terminal domain-containing protein [Acidobacteriota bacterium]